MATTVCEGTAPPVAECSLTLQDLDTGVGRFVPVPSWRIASDEDLNCTADKLRADCRHATTRRYLRGELLCDDPPVFWRWVLPLAATSVVYADPLYDFTFSGGGHVYEFQLPDFPPAQAHQKDNFFTASAPGTIDRIGTTFDVSFLVFGPPFVQNLTVYTSADPDLRLGLYGPDPYLLTTTPSHQRTAQGAPSCIASSLRPSSRRERTSIRTAA